MLCAYAELADHHLKYDSLDYAFLYYQEVLQYEINTDSYLIVRCYYGTGKVYENRKNYSSAISWLKQVVNYSINCTLDIDVGSIDTLKKCLLIFNEKLNDTSSSIEYMKEIINTWIDSTDNIDKINDLTAIQYYHQNDKTKIEFICDQIHEILDGIKIHDQC